MNLSTFLEHWKIEENPFLAEEARQDRVFSRLRQRSEHPDYAKILGDLERPSTAVVFGEKGAGKTAIRMQLEEAVRDHNAAHADSRVLVIVYDDLNPILDRFVRRVGKSSTLEALRELRLVDHIDAMLRACVPGIIDGVLGVRSPSDAAARVDFGAKPHDVLRRLDPAEREKWLVLQLLYDRAERVCDRARALRRRLRLRRPSWVKPMRMSTVVLWIAFIVWVAIHAFRDAEARTWLERSGIIALGVLTVAASGRAVLDRWRSWRLSRRLHAQLLTVDRSEQDLRALIESTSRSILDPAPLPRDGLDDPRYQLLESLRSVIGAFGYRSIIVLIDRVDEPTLINGDAACMQALIWPLFNNKFLQQDGFALKMMLPIELRHELHRQTKEFFQEARMDKQNLIDQLSWSGTTLYDLCSTRLRGCMADDGEPISLVDLFADDVTRQDIVDALDQMRQPRDAFKMMYQVLQDHCASTTDEEQNWRIPKLILDQVRRSQVERLDNLRRGYGPA